MTLSIVTSFFQNQIILVKVQVSVFSSVSSLAFSSVPCQAGETRSTKEGQFITSVLQ